jgi:sugar phosphate isomerase/epimerase
LEILRAAQALGAPLLILHVSSRAFAAAAAELRERARARDCQLIQTLGESAGEAGLELALENASHPRHPAYLLELRGSLGLPGVGVALDVGHANLRGSRAHEVAGALAAAIVHTHLHDNHGNRDEHLPPGRGGIDWPRLLAVLRASGYRGAWCVELKGMSPAPYAAALGEARSFLEHLGTAAGHVRITEGDPCGAGRRHGPSG